jgi:molybdopterin-guanine dinucleotide biosynthesis protein B
MSMSSTPCPPLRLVARPPAPPLLGIVGFSGSGKTTLTVGLIDALGRRGLRVATIKHDVHGFAMDQPGKDTWRHKQAGAVATLISSPRGIGLVRDADHDHTPEELLPLLGPADMVLVEGFKRAPLPKIEVFRPELGKPPACRGDRHLLAVVSGAELDWGVPCFAPGALEELVDFVLACFGLQGRCEVAPDRPAGGTPL